MTDASFTVPATEASNVYITNTTSRSLMFLNLTINKKTVFGYCEPKKIACGNTLKFIYNKKNWDEFSDIEIWVKIKDTSYAVDLNKDHYFGGGDFHYPGNGSHVNYVLSGMENNNSKIKLGLAYGESFAGIGPKRLIYSNDAKYMDKIAVSST